MTELICDICGTSYPDTAPKCPTCGYGRAFEVHAAPDETAQVEYEKVPGGRFSRKNVLKRLNEQTQTEETPVEETPVEQTPAEEPAVEPAQPEADPEREKAYRRDVALNLLLSAAVLAFLAAGGYLLVSYGIPYIQSLIG